jgi:hypothetical protein
MIPHSVMKPVMSAAGVTSKAGLLARTPSAVIRTLLSWPSEARPVTNRTSSSARSSIGI